MHKIAALVAFVLENVNGLLVVAGAGWCYIGVAGYSPRAANILAGGMLMAIGVLPYLVRRKRNP